MGYRRKSRELAMQALFYMDMSQNVSMETLELYCQYYPPQKKALPFFMELVKGVINTRSKIDAFIERYSNNWKIGRMSCVDRNVMRVAVYELLYCQEIPPKVSINEAIDVGKKFGTDESGAFINGILDSVRRAMEKEESDIKAVCPVNEKK
jgi:N utilization substance protein B